MPDRAHYVYRIQPTRAGMLTEGPTQQEAKLVGEHFAYLQDLVNKGVVILAARTLTADQDTFGVVIFNAASEDEALAIMNNDPAVLHGVMSGRLFPFAIALFAPQNAGNV